MAGHKDLVFCGSSREDLTAFPKAARQIAGHQLHRVQQGLQPDESKPMVDVGPGVAEIVIDTGDAFRVFYVAKFRDAVYVLHAFNKKSRKTAQRDLARGRKMFKAVLKMRKKPN